MADQLVEQVHAEIVLLGSADERHLARGVSARMRHPVLDATGQLDLCASFALIDACDLFIGNDSSLLHAAAALRTAYIGIIGPTSPASFRPMPAWPDQGRLVQAAPPCFEARAFVGSSVIWDRPECSNVCAALLRLEPERVVAAALEQLEVIGARQSLASLTPVI
jgi:ADP-heptose:LPS heptosyltransferase